MKNYSQKASKTIQSPQITAADIRHYLEHWEPKRLIDFLMEQMAENESLREHLQGVVSLAFSSEVPVVDLEEAIRKATDFSGWDFDDGYGSGYSNDLEPIIASLTQWLDRGYAKEVVELVEYTIEKVESALNEGHDSEDGELRQLLPILADLHHTACRQDTSLNVLALADRLFEMELSGETMHNVAENYADILREPGLARYWQQLQAEWDQLPSLTPENQGASYRRSQITAMMESLVRQSGDIEMLVQVKRRDLSKAGQFLDIAQLYQEAGKDDQALAWAEKGVQAFSKNKTAYGIHALQCFLAELYHRKNRHDDAIALIWEFFDASPNFQNYQLLKTHVDLSIDAGISWAGWRNKALNRVRHEIETRKKTKQTTYGDPPDHSKLVQIFIWEEDLESAWEEAQYGGCTKKLWLNLAHQLEVEAPDKAVRIYQQWVEPTVDLKKNDAYEEAAGYLQKINQLMTILKQKEAFKAYLQSLRVAHKAKRNFMKLLDSTKGL